MLAAAALWVWGSVRFSVRAPGNCSFILLLCGPLLKGFFAPVPLYVGFLRIWLSYAFLPVGLGWRLVCS